MTPHSVILQPPEWILSVVCLAVGAKAPKQCREFPTDHFKGHQPGFALEAAPDRPKDKKRFMWRTLALGTPNLKFLEQRL